MTPDPTPAAASAYAAAAAVLQPLCNTPWHRCGGRGTRRDRRRSKYTSSLLVSMLAATAAAAMWTRGPIGADAAPVAAAGATVPTAHTCSSPTPVCLGLDCQQSVAAKIKASPEFFTTSAADDATNNSMCVARPAWLRFPGVSQSAVAADNAGAVAREDTYVAAAAPAHLPAYVNQSQRLVAQWPRPARDSTNNTCTPEHSRCDVMEYARIGGHIPACDRHHLFELIAFFHDGARPHTFSSTLLHLLALDLVCPSLVLPVTYHVSPCVWLAPASSHAVV